MYPFAFAPYELWPVALIAFIGLYLVISSGVSRWEVLARCFLFGVGKFGAGTYWIFVSLHTYADISIGLSVALFATFLVAASALFSLIALFVVSTRYSVLDSLTFASGCCVVELAMSMPVAFSFPWLYLGYALIETPLSVFAPLGGVCMVGFAGVLSAVAMVQASRRNWGTPGIALALWCLGLVFPVGGWEGGERISVALVQGNVPLDEKWRQGAWEGLLQRYLRLSESAADARLVIWPESALPTDIRKIKDRVADSASALDGRLVFGSFETAIVGAERSTFNVVAALDGGQLSVFRKERLVPFGEYIPLRSVFGGALRPLGYPMSSLASSPVGQVPLRVGKTTIAIAICYEVAYPQIVRRRAHKAELLVVVSEDSWLGDTTGPWQHLQIARMRALELGKYLVRVTNDGITAIVDPTGSITGELERHQMGVLKGSVVAIGGHATLFARFGLAPIAALILLVLGAGWVAQRNVELRGAEQESNSNS